MNEAKTTGIFAIVAVVGLGMAYWSKPKSITDQQDLIERIVGTEIFKDFTDTESASSLQIIKYDEDLATLRRFEVARDDESGLWSLPSHDGYPADAAEQVRDATTPLIGLEIMSVESELRSDHELYGVVNPDDEKLAAGASGVGMLVRLKDDSDAVLASLIIGKEVEQAEGQRYVRKPTEDAIYKVELSTDAFTTEFTDWIEGELLDVRSFDITKVGTRDYELQRQSLDQLALRRNFDADVAYDSSESEWSLVNYQVYEGQNPTPSELAENEELNTTFLNSVRTSAQDLKIVDVQRKPVGLAEDLKADESLLKDQESVLSLQREGFYAMPGGTEILSAGGETIIGTDDGVNYVLRFGEATASLASASEDDEDGGLTRYLLVTARLDEEAFPMPELEVRPETVEEMLELEKAENGDTDSETSDSPEPDSENAQVSVPEKSEEGESEDATSEDVESGAENGGEEPADTVETQDAEQKEDTAETSQEPESEDAEAPPSPASDDVTSVDPDSSEDAGSSNDTVEETADRAEVDNEGDVTGESAANEDDSEDNEPEETEEELKERLEAVQEEIAKENQRKIDERNEKLDEARKKVQQLNARFAEWYYVVSDSEYQKLKLSRENLIKTNTPAESEDSTSFSEDAGLQLTNPLPNVPLPPQP